MNDPLVSIWMITYNHEKYLSQALEGVLMQKTSFNYEIVIGEDCSTDGTRNVLESYVKKYSNLIKPLFHDKNVGAFRNAYEFVLPLCHGKYIACLEGDDFWTDPFKLQKQVDFLEKNPDYGLVHTELDHYYVKNDRYVRNHWAISGVKEQSGDLYNSLLGGGKSMILACTSCFRRELILDIDSEKYSKYMAGDVALWLHISARSKIGYINESTAVRNVLNYSATQGRDFNYRLKFIQSSLHVFNDYNSLRPFSKEAAYNFKQRYSSNICNLCYQFRERYDLFDENYKNLDDDYKTLNLRLERFLFKYRIPKFVSRLILKITNVLFPSKIY